MIRVRRPREPKDFDARCRQKGTKWLNDHALQPDKEPTDFWSQFEPELRKAFKNRCGWLAM